MPLKHKTAYVGSSVFRLDYMNYNMGAFSVSPKHHIPFYLQGYACQCMHACRNENLLDDSVMLARRLRAPL
jgi:hypothetical protein